MPSKMKKVGIKAPILTAISYLLPLVLASGKNGHPGPN